MSFKYNSKNTGNARIEKAGDYEVYPSKYASQLTREKHNPMIVMNYVVRSDVDQPAAGALIQFDNFVDSENSGWRFNALSKATAAFQNDFDFGTMEGWAENMLGKPIKVRVKLDDKGYAQVVSFKESDHPEMKEQPRIFSHKDTNSAAAKAQAGMNAASGDPFANNGGPIDISDDDLPF